MLREAAMWRSSRHPRRSQIMLTAKALTKIFFACVPFYILVIMGRRFSGLRGRRGKSSKRLNRSCPQAERLEKHEYCSNFP